MIVADKQPYVHYSKKHVLGDEYIKVLKIDQSGVQLDISWDVPRYNIERCYSLFDPYMLNKSIKLK